MGRSLILAVIVNGLNLTVGLVCCLLAVTFFTLSIPVYLFRLWVKQVAKWCRADLGEMLNGQSAIFAVDYFHKTPPRSMVNMVLIFEGHVSYDVLKERVQRNWLRDPQFEKYHQHPVKWMGFSFWKDCRKTLSLDNHIHRVFKPEEVVTHQQVTALTEKLINRRLPRGQSPWELYLIENYLNDKLPRPEGVTGKERRQSAIIFNFHHCLMDGTGLFTSVVDGLHEGYSFAKMHRAVPQVSKQSFWQRLCYVLAFPLNVIWEISYVFSHTFRQSSFKIPDHRKEWHQVVSRSEDIIPVQLIKDIKNHFGVSYTSVILSAISAGVHRILGDFRREEGTPDKFQDKSVLCLSMLPAKGVSSRSVMSNHMTGAIFDLPVHPFQNPVERLKAVEKMLADNRDSVVPLAAQYITILCGAHLFAVTSFLIKNRLIPSSLSNFAGVPEQIKFQENVKWIACDGICGGFEGETGLFIISCSHHKHLGIQITAERAVMSQKQAEQLSTYIFEEVDILRNLRAKKS